MPALVLVNLNFPVHFPCLVLAYALPLPTVSYKFTWTCRLHFNIGQLPAWL